jgi:hypothetical protein
LEGGMVKDPDGPLWYRGLASGDVALEPLVEKIRKNFGVERIVISHTYADAAITPRYDRKVILIDIVYVLHRGTRLKQAAALDPAPSPLQRRIAELEMRLGAGAAK